MIQNTVGWKMSYKGAKFQVERNTKGDGESIHSTHFSC